MTSISSKRFKKNLIALSRHHPHVAGILDTPAPFPLSVQTTASGFPNLLLETDQVTGSLYPETQPTAGLREALEGMDDPRGRIICHYGFGLGLHALEIFRALAPANIVVLFEAHPAIFKAALGQMDLAALLSHPNVRLVVGKPVDFFDLLSGDPAGLFASVQHRIIRFERAVALAPDWYRRVAADMEAFNNYQIVNQAVLAKASKAFLKNRFRNLMVISRSVPMEKTAGLCTGVPAVIVAAGPSLSKNIGQLKGFKGRALLVAVDSAVGPLAEKGITPDLVVSADYNDFTYEKLSPFRDMLGETGLVFPAQGTFKVPNYIPFKTRFFTFLGKMHKDFFGRILQTDLQASLEQAQSVTHLAMHFVQQAGCDPIIFTGLDLAFDEGRDHAEGTVLHWGNRQQTGEKTPMVPGIQGHMVPTTLGFLNMITTCERMIEKAPDRTWIDATEGGAKVAGTRVMRLEAAGRTFCSSPVDVSALFELAPLDIPVETLADAMDTQRREVHTCLDRIGAYFDSAEKVDRYLSAHPMPSRGAAGLPDSIRGLLDKMQRLSSGSGEAALRKILADVTTGSSLDRIREHRARVMAAEASRNRGEIFRCAHDQLKSSQAMWREGFRHILGIMDEMMEALGALKSISGEDESALEALFAVYFDHDFLWLGEQCLNGMTARTPWCDFYSGAIRLRLGEVAEGLKRMEGAVEKDPALSARMKAVTGAVESEWLAAEGSDAFQSILRILIILTGHLGLFMLTLWPRDEGFMKQVLDAQAPSEDALASVKARLGDWEPVKDILPGWWALNAKWLSMQGEPLEGLAAVDRALGMNEEKNAAWLGLRARLLIEGGRPEEGISQLQEAVAMDRRTAVLWEELGDALRLGGDIAGALGAYENCLTALPDRLGVLTKIGDCYADAGRKEAAKAAYEEVIKRRERMADG